MRSPADSIDAVGGVPARWRRARDLLNAAVDLDPSERRAFLEDACGADEVLLHDVLSLLDAHERPGPLDRLGAMLDPSRAPGAAGRRVGRYRLVRAVGDGGMGRVYLAERDDGQFDKRVAVKMLPLGLSTEAARRRFVAERQVLARLEHPGIARLLDGGIVADGTPYLVMEYVPGTPIDRHCDDRRLDLDARLDLFLQVCDAVVCAHRALVVHGDLKPDNILVTASGRAKLLDFGIAHVLDGGRRGPGDAWTGPAGPLTPAYASPEQVRGDPVTTTSDVYSLGVLLYRLLAGRPPYAIPSRSPEEVEAVVCRAPPEPPSRVARIGGGTPDAAAPVDGTAASDGRRHGASTRRLRRRLRGDLDAIVMKALEKRPARRYASVDALADDIRRHRTARPVAARPATRRYRATRFLQRHRFGVAVAAVLTILVSAYATTTAVQSRRIAEQRDRADAAAEFMTTVLERLGPATVRRARTDPRAILDGSVERVRRELDGRPLLQARLFDAIGETYQNWGLFADARQLLEEALALRLRHLDPGHPAVADSRLHLGILRYQTADPATDSLFGPAIATYRERLGPEHPTTRYALGHYAVALRARGAYDRAEQMFRAVIAGRDAGSGIDDETATALLYLGKLLTYRRAYAEAEILLRDALAARRALYGDRHPLVANALDALGELLLARGDVDAADRAFRGALAVRREFFDDGHPDIGVSFGNLGRIERARGDLPAAESLARRSLDIARAAFGGDAVDFAKRLEPLAALRRLRGDAEGAERLYDRALTIWRRREPDGVHPARARLLLGLGELRLTRGAADRVVPLVAEALAIRRATLPDGDPRITAAETALAAARAAERR